MMNFLRILAVCALFTGLAACRPGVSNTGPRIPETQVLAPSEQTATSAGVALKTPTQMPVVSPTPGLLGITQENVGELREVARIGSANRIISESVFSPEGRVMAILWKDASTPDCHISLVDISVPQEIDESQAVELLQLDGEPFACTEGFTGFPSIAFSPDGRSLATISIKSAEVTFWDAVTGQILRKLPWTEPAGPVYGAVFSPNWKTMAWISRSTVQLMDMASGQPGPSLQQEDFVASAAFSPDSESLAAATLSSQSGKIAPIVKLWDVSTGKEQDVLSGPAAGASILVYSPSGDDLAWGSIDGKLHLWDIKNIGDPQMADENQHSDAISSVTFSPDGSLLASAGRDGVAIISLNPLFRINDAQKGDDDRLTTLSGQRIAFSPNGRLIALAMDGVISLWGIPSS